MLKLKDVMGTRYITEGNVERLVSMLKQDDEVYDISTCLITHTIASIMERQPMRFVDTTDKQRGYILDYNRKTAEVRERKKETPLPSRSKSESVIDYIKSLNNDEIYAIVDEQKFPLAAIVLILSPKKQLSFGYLTEKFGMYLSNYLYQRNIQKVMEILAVEKSFFLYCPKSVEEVQVLSFDQDSVTTTAGTFDVLELFSAKAMLPACIGTQRINDNPLYQEFWKSILEEVYAPENRDVSLFDLLQRK